MLKTFYSDFLQPEPGTPEMTPMPLGSLAALQADKLQLFKSFSVSTLSTDSSSFRYLFLEGRALITNLLDATWNFEEGQRLLEDLLVKTE